jgi:hypothetical protein
LVRAWRNPELEPGGSDMLAESVKSWLRRRICARASAVVTLNELRRSPTSSWDVSDLVVWDRLSSVFVSSKPMIGWILRPLLLPIRIGDVIASVGSSWVFSPVALDGELERVELDDMLPLDPCRRVMLSVADTPEYDVRSRICVVEGVVVVVVVVVGSASRIAERPVSTSRGHVSRLPVVVDSSAAPSRELLRPKANEETKGSICAAAGLFNSVGS